VVLEQERQVRAHVDAADGLRPHHGVADRAAPLLVRREIQDLLTGDRLRHFERPSFTGSASLVAKPSFR
jgi:hypothetical protein